MEKPLQCTPQSFISATAEEKSSGGELSYQRKEGQFCVTLAFFYMTRFDCFRCGKCCISFIDRIHHIPTGLALTPAEVTLFDQADVRPFLGVQTMTGITPVWYQLIRAPCPHYDHDRFGCAIYEQRPLVCRAYPFKVVLNYTRLGRCTWLVQQTRKNAVVLPAEIVQANETIAAYDRATFRLIKHEQVRIFNFETGAWLALQDN